MRSNVNLDFAQQQLDNLILRAPVTGLLTVLNSEIGQSISRGERFGQVDILDGFKVRAQIDEFHIARIEVGQTGTFTLQDRKYDLEVIRVYPQVKNGRFSVDLGFVGEDPVDIRRGTDTPNPLSAGRPIRI